MSVRKKFELGADVAEALKNIVNINNGLPEEHTAGSVRKNVKDAEKKPLPRHAPVSDESSRIFAWYSAMKPRAMCSFMWVVLLSEYAERHGGALVFDDLSELLGIDREKVVRAVNDLKRSGHISVIHSEIGAGGTVVSREVRFNVPEPVKLSAPRKRRSRNGKAAGTAEKTPQPPARAKVPAAELTGKTTKTAKTARKPRTGKKQR
jgi:hypothetical protein